MQNCKKTSVCSKVMNCILMVLCQFAPSHLVPAQLVQVQLAQDDNLSNAILSQIIKKENLPQIFWYPHRTLYRHKDERYFCWTIKLETKIGINKTCAESKWVQSMHEQNENGKILMQFSFRVQNLKKSKNFSMKLMKWKTAGTASPLKPLYWVTQNRGRGEGRAKFTAALAFITSQILDPIRWI